ncbi:MAG: tetratricopeptide repeat protein [Leptothrix sp. (in: b-proteobacteria)]
MGTQSAAWQRGSDPAKGFARPVAVLKPPVFAFQAGMVRPIAVNQGTAAQGQAAGEVCGGCHARRSELVAPLDAQAAFLDQYRPSLIEPGLYLPDGRIDGEVFEFGSFAQSAMHRAGVSCSHCHDSHDGGLRAPGNALCGQCHLASHYDRREHHGSEPGTASAQCVGCHMPTKTYMGVHVRHDHGLRVPGAPAGESAFARASALAASAVPDRAVLQRAIQATDALDRLGVARSLARLPPREAVALGAPLLSDARRAVRTEAARSLLGTPAAWWSAAAQTTLDAAVAELIVAEQLAADRPEALLNLGQIHARLNQPARAEQALRQALGRAPDFVPAYVNLADLYRQLGRDADGEPLLREAVRRAPQQAEPAHALGLLLIRQQRLSDALPWLALASRLAPEQPRYGHLHVLALLEAGRLNEVEVTLRQVREHHPDDVVLRQLQQRIERQRLVPQ